jgi:RNA polymerase sigma-70 factor (ECF subfamily)
VNHDLTADIPDAGIPDLVQQSQSGERCAFDQLVRCYQDRAMQAAVRILGDVHEASEAVQDGFVNAYLKIEKLRDPEKFGPWLLRIVLNTSSDRLRSIVRRKRRFTSSENLDNESVDDRTAEERELESAIQSAMSRLSKIQARAIALFGIEDLSHKEVADILDCSQQAARWHVHQARKKLKVLLKDYLE